jgi:hypothetical protein
MKFSVVVAIIDQASEDKAINIAKANGAGGVTQMKGVGMGLNEKKTFFRLTYERPEAILVFVLERRTSVNVMKALKSELDLENSAKGLIFTLPIEHLAGIPAKQLSAFSNRLKEENEI